MVGALISGDGNGNYVLTSATGTTTTVAASDVLEAINALGLLIGETKAAVQDGPNPAAIATLVQTLAQI